MKDTECGKKSKSEPLPDCEGFVSARNVDAYMKRVHSHVIGKEPAKNRALFGIWRDHYAVRDVRRFVSHVRRRRSFK